MEGDNDKDDIFSAKNRVRVTSHSLLPNEDDSETTSLKRQNLIETVEKHFDSEENLHDLAILYEITGFQGDAPTN